MAKCAHIKIGKRISGFKSTKQIHCFHLFSEYTCDHKYKSNADVLLMHKRDLNLKTLDSLQRNPNQIWLLWHDESNENSPQINKYKFNWTITYRTSAEASLAAYGITIVKEKFWSMEQFRRWIDEQFEQQANRAVW